jgi:hypothetical protein
MVSSLNDSRHIDYRDKQATCFGTTDPHVITGSMLPPEFKKQRNLCQKYFAKNTAGTMLMNPVMEPSDFNSVPRTGKAFDFVYRMSLFERPVIDLGGKKFTVQDSSIMSAHRADASALEISDSSLCLALALFGDTEAQNQTTTEGDDSQNEDASTQLKVARGSDGDLVVLFKMAKKGEKDQYEVRPYKPSYIRAALMITGARQEAQLQVGYATNPRYSSLFLYYIEWILTLYVLFFISVC